VIAIIGKLLINGVLISSTVANMSLPGGSPEPVTTVIGTTTASTRGGCTMGPNRFRLRTAGTAAVHPTRYTPWNTAPTPPEICRSTMAPTNATPSASSTAAHHGIPRREAIMARSSHGIVRSADSESLLRSRMAVTGKHRIR
jgi:hypothetical protein